MTHEFSENHAYDFLIPHTDPIQEMGLQFSQLKLNFVLEIYTYQSFYDRPSYESFREIFQDQSLFSWAITTSDAQNYD